MDWTSIIAILGLIFGTGGLGALLMLRHERAKLTATAHKTEAEADAIEGSNYRAIIDTLQTQYDLLVARVTSLETRVAALEVENRGLRRRIAQFRVIVQELWDLVCDHEIEVSCELGAAVRDALEDDAA